ncbi:MAG: M20/M25/M40 family metallo-hydrolase [Clostridia bacterium]|nr:M20/M25/M40 family metallo-hydrolase [Clostridia bacterium]
MKIATMNSVSGREGRLARYLVECLQKLGAQVSVDASSVKTGSDTGNIIARFPGSVDGAPVVLLGAHLDTVGPTEGMVPVIREGIIYSNGETVLGADDKAGIAIILAALAQLKTHKLPHGELEIIFTVQEEVGLVGAKNLTADLKADFGYILDGDGPVGTIINQAPSQTNLDLIVEGKAAHAGLCPEQGINAIVAASTAISRLRSGRIDEETTSNFGVIKGGKARNIVAERVEITAEVRSRNEKKMEREVENIIAEFNKTVAEFGARLEAKTEIAYRAFNIPASHPAVAAALAAARTLGVPADLRATGGGLDANILNCRGLPCVALGIGVEEPHSSQEHIPVSQLEAGVDYIVAILKEVAIKF